VAKAAPEDAAARLNLGLIALKLEWFAEAAEELEAAVRLRPDDRRATSYLAYAYAKLGRAPEAARAFRSAGQPELAAEIEGRLTTPAAGRASRGRGGQQARHAARVRWGGPR
jgi:tetratricopeptide (TPR) repeat protein